MSESDGIRPSRRARLQFDLRAVFAVVTGVSILLSLLLWRPSLGFMIAVPVVGAWWTAEAVRTGWRRLAYCMAAWSMGVPVYLLIASPISLASARVLDMPDPQASRIDWLPMADMCVASLVTALALRRWIRKPMVEVGVAMGIVGTYVGAAVFGWLWLACQFVRNSPATADPEMVALVMLVLVPIASAFVATWSLHIAGPAGVLACLVLRWIDPPDDPARIAPAPSPTTADDVPPP